MKKSCVGPGQTTDTAEVTHSVVSVMHACGYPLSVSVQLYAATRLPSVGSHSRGRQSISVDHENQS